MRAPIRVAINGFGRIGRTLFKLLLKQPHIDVVAINDISDARTLSHLLKYDSIHGVSEHEITHDATRIYVEQTPYPITAIPQLEHLSWSDHNVDVVIECTGKFKTRTQLKHHLTAGAKKVILSVPPQDEEIKMIVIGVNEDTLSATDTIISNASCTTNNAAPMLSVIHESLNVEQAYITTIHSYTTDQSLHDQPHKDLRRARAASQSIIPTTTGAAKALTYIFPDLKNVIGGCGIRVPVPNGSLTDMTLNVTKNTSIKQVNELFLQASQGSFKNILSYTNDPIVSKDILGTPYSCTFDAQMTSVIDGQLIKIIGWYDNETGYSNRIMDLISLLFIE
ncbi:type I glyceraldehyde-3-phosphate dehydrogenase [Gangjinia marincola]|uniref:Type I glyceraldehyde-3-phosphate dehydrogenase n=1 Tax=Gangjinia marincola TaxID=578463 RepID=A0ABN1MJ44_9FLAO